MRTAHTPLGLTEHARHRLLARGISSDQIRLTLTLGRRLRVPAGFARVLRLTVRLGNVRRTRQLVVIVNPVGSVVTAWWGEPPATVCAAAR